MFRSVSRLVRVAPRLAPARALPAAPLRSLFVSAAPLRAVTAPRLPANLAAALAPARAPVRAFTVVGHASSVSLPSAAENGGAAPSTEELELSYKRLVFHCMQRGWLELDLIMGSFVRMRRDRLIHDAEQQELLRAIAKEENSDLMRWLVEGWAIPEKYHGNAMMADLVAYSTAPNKPWYPTAGNQ